MGNFSSITKFSCVMYTWTSEVFARFSEIPIDWSKEMFKAYLFQKLAGSQMVGFVWPVEPAALDHLGTVLVGLEFLNHHHVGIQLLLPVTAISRDHLQWKRWEYQEKASVPVYASQCSIQHSTWTCKRKFKLKTDRPYYLLSQSLAVFWSSLDSKSLTWVRCRQSLPLGRSDPCTPFHPHSAHPGSRGRQS